VAKINGKCREVMEKTEWVAITSLGSDGPHMVGTWGDYIRKMGIKDDEVITIPARRYNETEENLKENGHVEGGYFPGQGCRISGKGELQTSGEFAVAAKGRFPWARGALVIKVEEVRPL
jgi:hypothetical protein